MLKLNDYISKLHGHLFWKEFSFDRNNFNPKPACQYEFADQVVWLNDTIFLYQIKERNSKGNTDEIAEEKWFINKILKKAKRQIKDTMDFIKKFDIINIENQQGHKFNVKNWHFHTIHKVILFYSNDKLPPHFKIKTHYISKKSGFIHLFSADKYLDICNTLITPFEINEYLIFREKVLTIYTKQKDTISEKALLGQFLKGDTDKAPLLKYEKYIDLFHNDFKDFDISFLFRRFRDQMDLITYNDKNDYYKILINFAKLKRNDLREIKKIITFCIQEYDEQKGGIPYRIMIPRLQIGFVFFAVPENHYDKRRIALLNFTYAAKYSHKLDKYIGMSISKDISNPKYYLFEWCYIEEPWSKDDEIEKKLSECNPFLKANTHYLHTYKFYGANEKSAQPGAALDLPPKAAASK